MGVHGIRNRGQGDDWPNQYEKISEEFRVEVLRSICAMNLKKSPGTHAAERASLEKVATEDADRIQDQYKIYKPDLTICGGIGDLFRTVVGHRRLEWRQTRRGIRWYQWAREKFVIKYPHPEARVQDSLLHYGLIDAVNELLASTNRSTRYWLPGSSYNSLTDGRGASACLPENCSNHLDTAHITSGDHPKTPRKD